MRWAVLVIAILIARPPRTDGSKVETITRTGKVVDLSSALKALDVKADPEPIAKQVVLVETDGTITPLLSDDASRALFTDERLRGRKTELTARKISGLPYLQVVGIQVDEDGELRVPEYYCDVCAISVRYPQICPCCQGPMELRMKPPAR